MLLSVSIEDNRLQHSKLQQSHFCLKMYFPRPEIFWNALKAYAHSSAFADNSYKKNYTHSLNFECYSDIWNTSSKKY